MDLLVNRLDLLENIQMVQLTENRLDLLENIEEMPENKTVKWENKLGSSANIVESLASTAEMLVST